MQVCMYACMYVRMYAMKLFSILEKPTCPEPRVCYYLQCYMLSGYSAKCSSSPASVLGTLAAMEASFTEIGAVAPQARTLIDAADIAVKNIMFVFTLKLDRRRCSCKISSRRLVWHGTQTKGFPNACSNKQSAEHVWPY